MANGIPSRLVFVLGGVLMLAGCDGAQMPAFLQGGGGGGGETTTNTTTRTVERDVEAPEVFQVADRGLWDGRPSLGGVWVAHPDVSDPERAMIRNESNGKFVIGVIYRPERQTPGPAFQVSSDAAEALGMIAGQPASLKVTALRREEVPVGGEGKDAPSGTLAAAPAVAATSLDDPIAAAAAALDAAENPGGAAAARATATQPSVASAKPSSGLSKPFIQIGIFSVKANANNTAESLRRAGMVPTIKPGKMNGKNFWRVIVGPAASSAERAAVLKKIKGLGFTDAYFVTN